MSSSTADGTGALDKAREKLRKYQQKQLRKQQTEQSQQATPVQPQDESVENVDFTGETLESEVALAAENSQPEQEIQQEQQEVQEQQYTAWEYQEYINNILLELESVRGQLNAYQEAAVPQSEDPASGLGLYIARQQESEAALAAAQAEIARLQSENDQSNDLLAKTQTKCRGLQQENHALQQRSLQLEEEFAGYQQEKARTTVQIQQLEKEVTHQMDTSSALKKQLTALSSAEKSRAELQIELDGSRDEIKGLLVQVETIKSTQVHQKQINTNLLAQVAHLEKEADVQNTELETVKQSLKTTIEEKENLGGKIDVLKKANTELERRCVYLQAELSKLQQQKSASEKTAPPAKESNANSVSSMSSQVISITERCQVLQDENTKLLASLEEMRTRNIALTNEKLAISDKLSGVESQYVRLVSNSSNSTTNQQDPSASAETTPSLPPIPYPSISPGSSAKTRRSSDPRAAAGSPRESDLLTQISTLTAKLLDMDVENKRLADQFAQLMARNFPEVISRLETQNGQLKNELEKERKVTILLQAEVDTLPDMIEKYHEERRALLQRINKESLDRSVAEKEVKAEASAVAIQASKREAVWCAKCASTPLVYI